MEGQGKIETTTTHATPVQEKREMESWRKEYGLKRKCYNYKLHTIHHHHLLLLHSYYISGDQEDDDGGVRYGLFLSQGTSEREMQRDCLKWLQVQK